MGRFIQDTPYIVALDFDGTVKSGKSYDQDWENWTLTPGFEAFVEWTKTQNILLVLWTCRNLQAPKDRIPVEKFFEKVGLLGIICLDFFKGAVCNYHGQPFQFWGTGSFKQYADVYVDDLAVGCPMLESGTPDWVEIKSQIEAILQRGSM